MDNRSSAVDLLKRITALRVARINCRERIAIINEKLQNLKVPALQTDPVQGGGNKVEDRYNALIDAKTEELRKHKYISREIGQFDRAWATLSDRDQQILSLFFIDRSPDCVGKCMEILNCTSRQWVYQVRDEALMCLTRALYGLVIT